MRAIPMLKEGLKKYGRLPMDEKEGSDYHDSFSFGSLEPVPCDTCPTRRDPVLAPPGRSRQSSFGHGAYPVRSG